jgi:2-polyprenyl-3-methyl-5-hydroxy-6-metoxy-1,4-benzoquinol methylase
MTELVRECPLCGSSSRAQFDRRQFRGHPVTNVMCSRCGLVYQSPRMSDEESQAFYEAEYRLLYQGQQGPNTKDMLVQTNRAQVTLDFIKPYVSSISNMLDIGSSTGILMHEFKQQYQAEVYGIEPGKVYRDYAVSTGLRVYPSLEELHRANLPRFSLVSMMHVLEHLPDPVGYLARLEADFLEPSGWLLLEVPNLYAHDCFEVAHLLAFSAHTLEQALNKAGYRVIELRRHGQPRSELIPLYITVLAQPDSAAKFVLKPERRVRLNRHWGFARRRLAERLSPQRAWLPTES